MGANRDAESLLAGSWSGVLRMWYRMYVFIIQNILLNTLSKL